MSYFSDLLASVNFYDTIKGTFYEDVILSSSSKRHKLQAAVIVEREKVQTYEGVVNVEFMKFVFIRSDLEKVGALSEILGNYNPHSSSKALKIIYNTEIYRIRSHTPTPDTVEVIASRE